MSLLTTEPEADKKHKCVVIKTHFGEQNQGGRQESKPGDSSLAPAAGPGLRRSQSHALPQERCSEGRSLERNRGKSELPPDTGPEFYLVGEFCVISSRGSLWSKN